MNELTLESPFPRILEISRKVRPHYNEQTDKRIVLRIRK
jgi:hypothetical protein